MKKFLLASIISVVSLPGFAQPASVQFINNSPDSTVNGLNIYLDGAIIVNNMMYKTANAFMNIMQVGAPVRISFSPNNGVYPADTFYSVTTTLSASGKYIMIANGTKDQARYNPARPFRVDIYNTAKETSSKPTETDILFAHGSTDLGTSDIKVGLKEIENDISFGKIGASYQTFESNVAPLQRAIRLTNAKGNKTLGAYNFDLTPTAGKAVVALTSGFMNPTINRDGPPFAFLIVSPNGMVTEMGSAASDVSRIQLIHNSADSKASSVDIYFNDSLAFNNISFRTASPFIDAYANVPLTVSVAPANSKDVNDTFFSTDIVLDAEKSYIGVLSGIESTTGYTPLKPMDLLLNDKAREEGTNSAMVDAIVVHGATDAPVIDIQDASKNILVNDLSYGNFSNYISVQPVVTTFDMTDASGNLLRRYNAALVGFGGQAGTILASGFNNPSANSNGAAFGLYLASAAGDALIPLPEVAVSVNDVKNNNGIIKIFPNPATDRLYIAGAMAANASAIICDITGKEVKLVTNFNKGIDISSLNNGIYILKLQDGNNTYQQKFSKQ